MVTNYRPDSWLPTYGTVEWRVRAVDAAGNESAWDDRSYTVDRVYPEAPSLDSPVDDSHTSTPNNVTLDWDAAYAEGSGVMQYRVEIYQGSSTVQAIWVMHPNTSYKIPRGVLSSGNTYTWHIRAHDQVGSAGAWSSTWTLVVDP